MPMPTEISLHLIHVYEFLKAQKRWVTADEISDGTAVAGRTVRFHLIMLAEQGVVERVRVFPGYRYLLSRKASPERQALVERLEEARAVFFSSADP